MFLLVSLSKSNLFTPVALVSFVQHPCRTHVVRVVPMSHSCRSCRTRIASVALMLHSCRSCSTRVAGVWYSCCKLDQIRWIDHSATISLQLEIETIINILMNLFGVEEKMSLSIGILESHGLITYITLEIIANKHTEDNFVGFFVCFFCSGRHYCILCFSFTKAATQRCCQVKVF